MLITTIVIASVAAAGGGGGLIARSVRRKRARSRALWDQCDLEAAAGRAAHPSAKDLLEACGFEILEGRPRPVPEMHGQVALTPVRYGGHAVSCEFTHDAIWRARREHHSDYDLSPDYERYRDRPASAVFLLEQVVSEGARAEYRPILKTCQACLHVYPLAEARLEGTSFTGRLRDHQSLRDVVAGIDAAALLEERREWLRAELGEVESRLVKAAYASPGRLAEHPHRGHPLALASGAAPASLDDPPDDRAKAMPAIKTA